MLFKLSTLRASTAAAISFVALAIAVLVPPSAMAQSAGGSVSYRQPDGLAVSTGNLYFTSHVDNWAAVWRTSQTAMPGQETLLYGQLDARFGDLIYAQVDGTWWGYFFATRSGIDTIRRVPLTGGSATIVKLVKNVDVVNSHRNLVTDGVNLYWQDINSVRKMPIRGGVDTVLDTTNANTPTAGLAMQYGANGRTSIIYADGAAIRYVPTGGSILYPLIRTIATASSRVTTLHAVSNGVYWGEQGGAVRVKVGSTTTTLPSASGLAPTSISTNGATVGAGQAWTQCSPQSCRVHIEFNGGRTEILGAGALGVTVTPDWVFWGDKDGIHRRVL